MDQDQDRTNRQMAELLQELRIALPGVQFLFAFLLTAPFAARFEQTSSFQRTAFFVALMTTALSAVCLIAVPATHRLRFQQRDREFIIAAANRYLIASLVFLAVGMSAALVCLTDFLYGGVATWLWPGVVAIAIVVLWFVRPLMRERSSGP
jgi:formate-dependent nitrite reductase membrane component NrfD